MMAANSSSKEVIVVHSLSWVYKEYKRLQRMLWWKSLLVLVPLGLLAAAGPARLEKIFTTTSQPRISVTNLRGQVVVKGWDKSQVRLQSSTLSPRVEVDAEAMPPTGPAERIQVTTHVM